MILTHMLWADDLYHGLLHARIAETFNFDRMLPSAYEVPAVYDRKNRLHDDKDQMRFCGMHVIHVSRLATT